jgi:hypothetical protein
VIEVLHDIEFHAARLAAFFAGLLLLTHFSLKKRTSDALAIDQFIYAKT